MRDPERQNIFGNKYSVSFPDFPTFTRSPRYAVLRQEANTHDTLELHYQHFSPMLAKAFRTGTPVKFTWTNDKARGTFIGYTSDVTWPVAQKLNKPVVITCVAASFSTKQNKPKIWKNKTVSEIMVDIAKTFKLKPVVTTHNARFTQQSISRGTYWNKITELANTVGYAVKVIGAELHFHPIDKMIDMSMTTIPVMAHLDPYTNPQSHFSAQTLDEFESKQGDYVELGKVNRSSKIVYGVDPLTAKQYNHQSSPDKSGKQVREKVLSPLFQQTETNIVTGSKAAAQTLAEGQSQLARLAIPGYGKGKGDPRISPWATIEVRGTGDISDGFWIVTKTEHTIHFDGRYIVKFWCAADGIGGNKPSAFRPTKAGKVPVVNTDSNHTMGYSAFIKQDYKLSSPSIITKMDESGWTTSARRWKG
jgi:phage protein D